MKRAGWKHPAHVNDDAGSQIGRLGVYSVAVWRSGDGVGWTWSVMNDARGRAYDVATGSRSGWAPSRTKAKRAAERVVDFMTALRATRRWSAMVRRRTVTP